MFEVSSNNTTDQNYLFNSINYISVVFVLLM